MATGLEIRAQIDTELVKGLLLINGGGAIALLAFLPTVIGKPEYAALSKAILWALLTFQVGLLAAVIHNRLRRVCSSTYEMHAMKPPPCNIFPFNIIKFKHDKPCVCRTSVIFMWVSVLCFFLAGLVVLKGGLDALDNVAASNTPAEAVCEGVASGKTSES
jgi:hypothetical protein